MSHTGPSGRASISDRCKLYNYFRGWIGENIAYAMEGISSDHDRLLATWAIDDGVPSDGHFFNLFASKYTSWGVGIYETTYYGRKTDWVTTFFGTTASCCHKCPFSSSVRSTINWTGITSSSIVPTC